MIDPKKPIIAICGQGRYKAEIVEIYDGPLEVRPHAVVKVLSRHRLRVGGDLEEPQSWNFFLDDGKWNGPADIRIANTPAEGSP